ncbi:hypothetical protein CYMTET_43911 [Cymbomonas tetramitiformis]|uniref:Uncharacterized protein n=1 Tax=Cymbomonas tetramitiformis TaxID=36881 RepID=A0AAE0EZI8_9CHLO|nr:hypothetical protein CYMTET_43911 [Cymbomonas tetramitiformis]
MMQIYRASVKPDPKGRRSLRNVIRQHFELADKRLTGRCSPAETVVLEKTKAWIRARGGIVTSRNTVIDVPGVLDEPSPWNVMEPEVDLSMRATIDSDRDEDGDVAPNDMQDAVEAAVNSMGEILLSPPPTPVQDAVLPTVRNDESSDDEDPTTWDQHRLYAAAEEAMRKYEYWMGANNFFVKAFESSECDSADNWTEILGATNDSTSMEDDVTAAMNDVHVDVIGPMDDVHVVASLDSDMGAALFVRDDEDPEAIKVLEVDTEGNTVRACMEKRFEVVKDESGKEELRPKEWFYYFGLRNIIRRWLGDPAFGELRARADARTGEDFWTSAYAKSINAHPSVDGALFRETPIAAAVEGSDMTYFERHTMVIAPGADDCQVWNSDIGSYSMGVAVVKADDLHISARQQDKWHSMLWISRGPRQKKKNVHVLWGPFQDELLELMPGADMRPGVGGYRSDAYSVFEGTAGPDGKGMYYKGYAKKVEQTLHTVRGATTVHAWDPSLFLDKAGHDRLVALAERGGDPSMLGRHGRGALERIPYFDPMRAYAHPYGHAKLYGVVKRTLKLFLGKLKGIGEHGPLLSFPKSMLDEIQRRAPYSRPPHDVGRKYHDIVQYFGMWTMEDFLNFVLYYAPLVFGDLLLKWNVRMDRAWQ